MRVLRDLSSLICKRDINSEKYLLHVTRQIFTTDIMSLQNWFLFYLEKMTMVLTSAGGIISLLEETEPELQIYALR